MTLKKLIAVAAAALPLAASAQQAAAPAPLYQIYGTLNVNAQYVEIGNPFKAAPAATPTNIAGRVGVSIDSSNVGIRGTADTGQFGLGVVYQCETGAQIDGDGTAPVWCARNSRLGLSSAFGTLFYGNWDSPFKSVSYGTKGDDAFGNTDIYDAGALMGSVGFKTKSSAGLSATNVAAGTNSGVFNVRTANSITYHSPKFEGAQVKAQYGTNERASNNGALSGALYSLSLNYDRGPFSVFAAYERHDDWQGLGAIGAAGFVNTKNTVDTGIRVGGGYELGSGFGATTLGAEYELLTLAYANTKGLVGNVVKEASRGAVMVNAKHRMGNHEFRLRWAYADGYSLKWIGTGPKGAVGTGAVNYALGYAYYLNAATQVYAYYTKIENERNASYTFATGGPAALTAAWSNGADPAGAGLGMRYAF